MGKIVPTKLPGVYRTGLVLEFEEGVTPDAYPLRLTISIHGREGTLEYVWGVQGRLMTPGQLNDLLATVSDYLIDRFEGVIGLQGELGYG